MKNLPSKKQLTAQKKSLPILDPSLTISPQHKIIAGVDEAGRGAWAGPVVAAAVIWPQELEDATINDSKQLTPLMREQLFLVVQQKAVAIGVGVASVEEVDGLGVGKATYLAMHRAVAELKPQPDLVIVDGYRVNFPTVESLGLVGGDGKSIAIAAASIVAKVTRDRMMVQEHNRSPRFGFAIHKGYGTALHRERLERHGVSKIHRRSFTPIRLLLEAGAPMLMAGRE